MVYRGVVSDGKVKSYVYGTTKPEFGDKQINLRITTDFKERCDASAKKEGISLNEWIRRAMRDRLLVDCGINDSTNDEIRDELLKTNEAINHLKEEIEAQKTKSAGLEDEVRSLTALFNSMNPL